MQDNDDRVVPEVVAWRDRDRFKIWCRFCVSPHFHRQTGWQAARCPVFTDYTPTGYILVEGSRFHSGRTVRMRSRKL
jgi:hypothetical protein